MNKQEIKDLVDSLVPQIQITTKNAILYNLSSHIKDEDKREEAAEEMHNIVNRAILSNGVMDKCYRDAEKFYDVAELSKTEGVEAGLQSGMTKKDVSSLLVATLTAKLNDEARETAKELVEEHRKAIASRDRSQLAKFKLMSLCMQFVTNLSTLACSKIIEKVFNIDLSDHMILSENRYGGKRGADIEVSGKLAKFTEDGQVILGDEVDVKKARSLKEVMSAEFDNKEDEEENLEGKVWN